MKKIAILGATGHIAKNLIFYFKDKKDLKLYLYARSKEKLNDFLNIINYDNKFEIINLNNLKNEKYNAIINCIGIVDPKKLIESEYKIFRITEYFDNLILNYLGKNKECKYINFSSGAVYGNDFSSPADYLKYHQINVNEINPKDYYGITKLYSEVKHRSHKDFNIIDLRIFGFFSRFIDLNAKFFITELISCIITGIKFLTGGNNIIRDFIYPNDLFNLVNICINIRKINDAIDVYSLKPATKFEILNYFAENYGLKYRIESGILGVNATGIKDNYYSINKKAEKVGYIPEYSSLDCIVNEAKEIL